MTDRTKTAKDKAPAKRKKLQLHKETLQDLSPKQGERVKGGLQTGSNCDMGGSGCGHCGSHKCS